MSDRLSRAIQRIAKSDPDLRGAIEATRNRGDQPGASGVGTSESERDRICCDGSVNDDPNPGTDTRDPDSGGQDASGGLNPDDPADIGDMGPGSLTGVHDCATGEPVCFEGADWVPPEGWDGPSDPPVDDLYEGGFWWAQSRSATSGWASPEQAMSAIYPGQDPYCFSSESFGYRTRASRNANLENFIECGYSTNFLYRRTCGSSTDIWCTEVPISEAPWPTDSCVNLAIKGGSIVGSKYDPENDGSYSKPMSEIELCDDFGNSFKLAPSAGGGWKTISAQNPGDGYLYDSSGRQIARISESEYSDPAI